MLQRVRIQILDNPLEEAMLNAEDFDEPTKNKMIADELRQEMNHYYPTVVSVEYIDLFMNDEIDFPEVMELIKQGAVSPPIILINGIPKIHGGIPRAIIKDEVERLIYKGPLH